MEWLSAIYTVLVGVFLIIIGLEIAMRFAPNYNLIGKYPGPPRQSFWELIRFIYLLNPESTFSLIRGWSATYKQSFVTWNLVNVNLEAIRAHEMELVLATSKHTEKGMVYDLLRPFLGDGLLNSNGKKWQRRRRILTPTFHFSILQQFLAVFK